MKPLSMLMLAVACLLFGPDPFARDSVLAQAQGQKPRTPQQERTPEEFAKFLEGADRVARMQVPRVVAALELKPGMKVADIGAGSGLFTRPIAQAIAPQGVAYAVDIDPALLKIVERSASEQKIPNIRTLQGGAADPKLPEPVDLAFICDTLHHIEEPAAYLLTLKKYLKPGGRVAVIDFSDNWPQGHESMRFTREQLEGWTKTAGLTQVADHAWLENSFFVIYRVP
jgi:ubiquinone/menaquinone biosynthesis C-methylase UbiE